VSSVLTRVRHLNLSRIAASKFRPRPASPSQRTDRTLHARSRPFVKVANSLTSPRVPRARPHTNEPTHGRTTKKKTGSSTPMATLPM